MDIIYIILIIAVIVAILSLVFNIFMATWPFILAFVVVSYLYKRFFKKPETKTYEEEIEESYYNPFEGYSSSTPRSADVIDVEYTEHEEE